jgi:microcystin-dependent protein
MSIGPPVGSLAPIGAVMAYAGSRASLAQSGWLVCDGSQVSVVDYPLLVQALGNRYGGDGTASAKVPDMRGMFVRGVDGGARVDPDASKRTPAPGGQTDSGTTQGHAFASHAHRMYNGYHKIEGGDGTHLAVSADESFDKQTTAMGTSSETRPRNIALYWIIKAG